MEMDGVKIAFFIFCIAATASSVPVNCNVEQLRYLQHSLESLESKETSSEEVGTTTIITTPLPPVQPAAMADSTPDSTHPVVTNTNTTTEPVETTLEPQTNEQAFDFMGTGSPVPPLAVNTPALESPIMQTTNVTPPEPYPLERNNSTLPGPARGDNMEQL